MKKGKITLLISTYNWKEALRLCLLSVSVQTVMPDEILIADDGSKEDTRFLIDEFRGLLSVPIIHVWHEDRGFRKTIILNQALAKATGDYIVQIDGDVILERHFIQDHQELMERGYFVCGSRTKIGPTVTKRLVGGSSFKLNISNAKVGFVLNGFRSRKLRTFLAERYAKKIDHMRGCNMAYWRDDFVAINGYNEELLDWGHEDGELVYRLHFLGVKKKFLKMGGIVYHLWHKEASKHNEGKHLQVLDYVKENRIKWCPKGVDKYLNKKYDE